MARAPEERRSDERRWRRWQAGSGLVFAFFLILHLATTGSAAVADYDRVLTALRRIYRPALPVELALVFVPAGIHIVTAVRGSLRRRRQDGRGRAPFALRLHRYAGYFLLAAIVGHVAATRLVPTFGEGPTATGASDFAYLAFSLLNWPAMMRPYYVLLGLAGSVHLCIGVALAAKILWPSRVNTATALRWSSRWAGVVTLAVTAGVVSIIVGAPAASRLRFPEFAALYARYVPLLTPRPEYSGGEFKD